MRTLLFVLLSSAATANAASDGFRCRDTQRLVDVGDSMVLVANKCRAPDQQTSHQETRYRRVYERRLVNGVWQTVPVDYPYTVQIDDWLYDFGRNNFVRLLRFENNILFSVADGGYGTNQ